MIELKSFDLKVQGSSSGGYTVEAVGPAGERNTAPFDWAAPDDLSADLEALQTGEASSAAMERVGTALFHALLPLDVMMVYVAAKARLGPEEGLRLRLHLPPELARLPWELLYYRPHYLSVDPRTPLIRFLDLPDPPRPLTMDPPLRLLHLIASPVDARALDVAQEAEQLRSALAAPAGRVRIVPAQPGTLAALRDGLRQGCHVLHFSGHGGFSGGKGYLLFEDEQGRAEAVDSDMLAHLLRGSSVRLAVLNACQSAQATDSDAFGSVAAALVRAGLPAVIAHQYPLPDSSALAFTADFYRSLAAGLPVDMATSEGRKAILSTLGTAWREHVDWATPVLFMNAPDGHILNVAEAKEEGKAEQGPAAPVIHGPVFIGDDAVTIGAISGGEFTFDFGSSRATGPAAPALPATDPLPQLLVELRQVVRDHAPAPKRDEALAQVAALRRAASEQTLDLASMEAVLEWFQGEVPSLGGAVLSVILQLEARAGAAGDEVLMEFRRRFGDFP